MATASGNAPLSVTLSLVDKATAPLRAFSATVNDAMKPVRDIKNRIKLTSNDLGIPKLGKAFKGVGKAAGGVVKEVKALSKEIAILTGLGVGFLSGIVYSTANAGDVAYKTAQKVGISTEAWTKMEHAAKMSNLSSDELKNALNGLNDMTMKAARGNGEAQGRFRALGIEFRDAAGKLKPANVLFEEAAERIGGIEDPFKRAQAASVLFGKKMGPELVPLLSAGKEGLQGYYAEAERLGKVFTDDQGEAAAAFASSISRVKDAILGLMYAIGNQLIPIFEPWINYVENLIADNRELVYTTVAEWIEKIRKGFTDFLPKLTAAWEQIVYLAKRVDSLVESLGGWMEVLPYIIAGIAALKLAPLILSVGALAKAVIGLGMAILTTPIGWIVLGIAALVTGFIYLWRNCEGFRDFWLSMWDKVVGYINRAVERIKTAFDKGILQGIYAILAEFNPVALIASAIDGITEYFFGVSLTDAGINLITSLWEGMKSIWGKISSWFDEKIESLTGWMPDWVREKLGLKLSVSSEKEEQPGGPSESKLEPASVPHIDSALGPPVGVQEMIRQDTVSRSESVRDAHVSVEVKAPQGTDVKTKNIDQAKVYHSPDDYAYNGFRMGF